MSLANHAWKCSGATLILNTDSPNQVHPAPASMESSFCSWIQSSAILLTTLTLGHDMNKETELAYLDELAEDLELKLQSSEMNRYEELIKSGSESELNDIFAASSPYDTAALNQNFLVLFRTEKGFLGYGPLFYTKGRSSMDPPRRQRALCPPKDLG